MRDDIKRSLQLYVDYGLQPGGFLTAVLENNLSESFGRADMENRYDMFEIVSYIYNNLPRNAWGSPEVVYNWKVSKSKTLKEFQNGAI